MTTYTPTELRKCAEREVNLRRVLFPRWIEQGKMKPEVAKAEIQKMQAIVQHFIEIEDIERQL